MRYTWDLRKAESNARAHGVTFEEAATVFDDPNLYVDGQEHAGEHRLLALGYSSHARILYVVFVERRADEVRIISARKATRYERKIYEEAR